MDFFISTAAAQAAAAPSGGTQPQRVTFARTIGLFVFLYFMMIRPQSKKAKEHREMIAKLAVGDEVVTAGGILGRVTEAGDTFVTVEVAKGVALQVQRFQVSQLMPKGTYKA